MEGEDKKKGKIVCVYECMCLHMQVQKVIAGDSCEEEIGMCVNAAEDWGN